jgi:sialate O-acetylesterase
MKSSRVRLLLVIGTAVTIAFSTAGVRAEIKLPALISDHMVLQQKQKNKIWGSADAGEKVAVTIGAQRHETTAGADGKWQVTLQPLSVGGPLTLSVQGKNAVKCDDVLVGEVWICSGQSNMQWNMALSDAEEDTKGADLPAVILRLGAGSVGPCGVCPQGAQVRTAMGSR